MRDKMVKKCPIPMDATRLRLLKEEKRREERIKLAIAKGKQTVLPTQTKSIKLSKFEHYSDEGPLVVFAEELAYPFGNFGNYQAVRQYQSGYDIGQDYSKPKKAKKPKTNRPLMLHEKPENTLNGLNEKSSIDNRDSIQNQLKLPKLKSGPIAGDVEDDTTTKLELSRNTEFPKLPAKEYIDSFRRDAAEFERNLMGIGRGNAERKLLKGKPRESLLPRIDERSALSTTNSNMLAKEEHFRLPRLQQKREDCSMESSKKRRKTKNNSEARKYDNNARRSLSHSERKVAAQKEQAKWCKMTLQSNAYV